MSRATRIEFPGAFYHVMSRGIARRRTFFDDLDKRNFLGRIGQIVGDGDLVVHAYCLMNNHYHLLLETPRSELSRWMKCINGEYAQWFNYRHEQSGHVWQGRYKAILIGGGDYLLECSRYIHLNPNRALKNRQAERWKWSSYRNYIRSFGKPVVRWVETKNVLNLLHSCTDARSYREYIESEKDKKPISPFERATAKLVLGSDSFVEWVRDFLKTRKSHEEEPAISRLKALGLADPDRVEIEVERVFRDIPAHRRRRLKLYCLKRWTRLSGSEAARRFGLSSSATGQAIKSVESRLKSDSSFLRKMRLVGKMVSLPNAEN